MGSCFSKKKFSSSKDLIKENEDASESNMQREEKSLAVLNNEKKDQRFPRKEVFLIRHPSPPPNPQLAEGNVNFSGPMRKSSRTKEELDSILVNCQKLSRSNSSNSKAVSSRRRRSGSKTSFDFDDQDEEIERCQLRKTPSREREQQHRSGSKERGVSGGGGRRLSQSPGRRSENSQSPATSIKPANGNSGNSGSRPGKMVSVPATVSSLSKDKTKKGGNVGEECSIKRVYVKRHVSPHSGSPSRTNPKRRNHSGEIELMKTGRRTPLSEIDPNTLHYPLNRSRSAMRSRDLNMNPEISSGPSTSYACFLLEDIRNFHQKNKAAAAVPSFTLPPCVSKACSIVEAIADLNSTPSYNLSTGRKIGEGKSNFVDIMESNFPSYVTMKRGGDMEEQESWGSNSFSIDQGRSIPAINST